MSAGSASHKAPRIVSNLPQCGGICAIFLLSFASAAFGKLFICLPYLSRVWFILDQRQVSVCRRTCKPPLEKTTSRGVASDRQTTRFLRRPSYSFRSVRREKMSRFFVQSRKPTHPTHTSHATSLHFLQVIAQEGGKVGQSPFLYGTCQGEERKRRDVRRDVGGGWGGEPCLIFWQLVS